MAARRPVIDGENGPGMVTRDMMSPHRPGQHDANALAITGTLLVGPALWCAIGLGLDHWWGTGFLGLVGIIAGAATSVYAVYLKWGR